MLPKQTISSFYQTPGYKKVQGWLATKSLSPFAFQQQTWHHIHHTKSGLVNAPTGCGKTYSVFLGSIISFINTNPHTYQTQKNNGLQLLWITPLRALANDIARAMEEAIAELNMTWKIGIRNGDTTTKDRDKQKKQMPEVLIITPESLMLLLATKNNALYFESLQIIAIDEWHELIGSKRGVQVELAISRLVAICGGRLSVWGISATIGNLQEAKEVLLAPIIYLNKNLKQNSGVQMVVAHMPKQIKVTSIFPDEIEKFPWAGHLGIKLVQKIIPIILQSRTTLIFINTRGMSETWYQTILEACPELAGSIALHHGSIERELRTWVEDALHSGTLKAVVCTASLDLGVDFRPVETVIQVGSPKGVSRFLQRAGRSGHQPGAVSNIYFLPTHSLELAEAAALKTAVIEMQIESKEPMVLCYDVLVQYLCTLAVGGGFAEAAVFAEVQSTHCFASITRQDWLQTLQFVVNGGSALQAYDEFKKVEIINGIYQINNRRIAMRHRMQIGTIVSDAMLKVKFISGGFIGVIEEYFISRLLPGNVFTLAGRNVELVQIKEMTVLVKKSNSKKSIVPSWQGGRMPLSSNLSAILRQKIHEASLSLLPQHAEPKLAEELQWLQPLFLLQKHLSAVPLASQLLVEQICTKDGYHLFVYPFEGRLVHEAMAALLACRISENHPITFSIAMNDYGFELLSDQPIPVDDANVYELFSLENLLIDIQKSTNAVEMAKRKFRDIAVIGGLLFQGMPGEQKKARHLQSSAALLYKVFCDYDAQNLLLRQAYQEVFFQQMEEARLRRALQRIAESNIIITFPQSLTPFCFPIKVDSIRENFSTEKLEDRIKKMLNG